MLDGELTHEKWDENESENLLIVMILHFVKMGGGHYKTAMKDEKFHKVQYDPPLQLSIREFLNFLYLTHFAGVFVINA